GVADHAGAEGAAAPRGREQGPARMDPLAGAFEILAGHHAPALCRGELCRLDHHLLLLAAVPVCPGRTYRPRADEPALPADRLYLHPHDDRPGPAAAAGPVSPAAVDPLRHHGLPRLLRRGPDQLDGPDPGLLVRQHG